MDKIRDVVGLYLIPPVAAMVFAVDEKPQIQALNRSAPTLPMLPTTPARATHDYERNGTLDLFAALDIGLWPALVRSQSFRSLRHLRSVTGRKGGVPGR